MITPKNHIVDDTIKRLLEMESSKRDVFLFERKQIHITNRIINNIIHPPIALQSKCIELLHQLSTDLLNSVFTKTLFKQINPSENILNLSVKVFIKSLAISIQMFFYAMACIFPHFETEYYKQDSKSTTYPWQNVNDK